MPNKKAIDQKDAKKQNNFTTDKDRLASNLDRYNKDQAAAELSRAARLERIANELLIEARSILSQYAKPRMSKPRRSMVELVKSLERGRGDGTSKP